MTCKAILKILMFIFNTVIFVAGVVTVVVGFLVEINRKYILAFLDNIKGIPQDLEPLASAGYLLIAVGAILTFMGFLGCCGACCENKCMLMTFFIIIFFMFVAEVVAALIVLLYQPTVENLLNKIGRTVARNIKENYGQNKIITNVWIETMSLMKCCGYNNYTDFTGSSVVNSTSQYPEFCCPKTPGQCDIGKAAAEHVDGCFDVVVKLVKSNSALLGAVAVCIAAIEVAVMIVSLILQKSV